MASRLRLVTLGQLRLLAPEGELLPRRRKELALLAYLATQSPRAVRRARLQALIWGDRDEARARNSLRQALLRLRRAIGDVVEVGAQDVALRERAVTLDIAEFEVAALQADACGAIGLWTGEFLAESEEIGGESFAQWAAAERARLKSLLATCFERCVAEAEQHGAWQLMAARAEQWTTAFPDAEAAERRLLQALHFAGRNAEARARHAAFTERLRSELGTEPSAEWRRIGRELARDAPAMPRSGDDALFPRLMEAWRAVAAGRTQRLLLIGDSDDAARHVEEIARWITFTSRRAIVLRASPESTSPLGALLEPLAAAPELAAATPADLASLSALVPSVAKRFLHLPDPPPGVNAAESMARVIDAVADEVPLALICRDFAAMDSESRTTIARIPALVTKPVFFVFTDSPGSLERASLASGSGALADFTAIPLPTRSPREAAGERPRAKRRLAIGAVAALVIFVAAVAWVYRANTEERRVLAVGTIQIAGAADSVGAIRGLLGRGLERIPGLTVLSNARVEEMLDSARGPTADTDHTRAATRAGATEVIEGTVAQLRGGALRADLRRLRTKDGETMEAYVVESADARDLIDLLTERIAADLGRAVPTVRLSGTSASLVAYRMYEEGLRAYYAGDNEAAKRLFRAALEQDSSFAMAAYYLSRTVYTPESWNLLQHAVAASASSPERERLLIRTAYAVNMQDPRQIVFAESLASRHPLDPDARLTYADALIEAGHFGRALPHLRAVVTLDSLSLAGKLARCRACDALSQMTSAYYRADSVEAFERTARMWTRLQPQSANSWLALARSLGGQDRHDEALAAARMAARFNPSAGRDPALLTDIWMRAGDFETVDRTWADYSRTGNDDAQMEALWSLTISYRLQGRFRDALAMTSRMHALSQRHGVLRGLVLYDLKRYRESAALFDAFAAETFSDVPSRDARARAWNLTHAATGYAAAGDTGKLRILEDSIRKVGSRSAYRRDQLLHHYVRGLRLKARGLQREAAAAFRQSLYSPTEGHLRANLELARALIASGQHGEAISVLRAALRGPIGASGLYATRTELQELLAAAYLATGQADSAALQLTRVAKAWQNADPELQGRRAAALQTLETLRASQRGRSGTAAPPLSTP